MEMVTPFVLHSSCPHLQDKGRVAGSYRGCVARWESPGQG